MSGAPNSNNDSGNNNHQWLSESDDDDERTDSWMTTYADMVTLLLCFFVLILSFSQLDVAKFKEIAGSMSRAFGVQKRHEVLTPPMGTTLISEAHESPTAADALFTRMQNAMEKGNQSSHRAKIDIELFQDYRGIVLRVNDTGLFHSGSYEINPTAWPFLDDIIAIISTVEDQVSIETHSDARPIATKLFRNNWDLSARRSVSLVDYFKKAGKVSPQRLAAVSRGDAVPAYPSTSKANMEKNRRVEFIVHRTTKPRDD